jgi:NADH:ubiquinone oxidoreductase subunit 6 (subunit J)
MNLVIFLFYFFASVAAISALALALTRNVFYGALLLIVCLLALAGIYVIGFAEFVAVTQILIYAGGILVVIIFGIMLTSRTEKPLLVEHTNIFAGVLVASCFFGLIFYLLTNESFPVADQLSTRTAFSHINTVGLSLMTVYMLPFEVAGFLLLMALVAAAVIASTVKRKA